MACKNCCNGHTWVSITGLSISGFELILACVYNFHLIGFGFSLIGIITSGLYLHFAIRDKKVLDAAKKVENRTSPANASTQLEDSERLSLVPAGAHTSVSILKAQQV